MGHPELLEVLYARHHLDSVAIPLVGHDGEGEAVPLGAGRTDEHAIPRVFPGLIAQITVSLYEPLGPCARVAGVVKELLGGLSGAEDAEIGF